ncbi:hypothetical protein CTheo_3445 [Ceratobasidium theobromae]|uniref:Uncharacterized protein n=1 Tax=Ceratobasidium theobromae TaxID=1582974 RepID=A0A5N5QNK3_9AGAM|nr:hypothetical protein CTheo_3445 [Ceratobasidium theobromae]
MTSYPIRLASLIQQRGGVWKYNQITANSQIAALGLEAIVGSGQSVAGVAASSAVLVVRVALRPPMISTRSPHKVLVLPSPHVDRGSA